MSTLETLSQETRLAIRDLLSDPIFELIPLPNVAEQARHLPAAARVSVTASPQKTLEDSLDLAAELMERGHRVIPHLSARMTKDMAHLESLLRRISELGVKQAFVVGGDPEPAGDFFDGLSLLQAMERIGHDLEVGVPCYPEGHPQIPDAQLDQALTDKQRYASWMTSQMCFDPAAVTGWLRRQRERGVTLPLVLGIPGAAERAKLLRISARIGVGQSLSFLRKNVGLIGAFVRPGGYDPAELLVGLGADLAEPDLRIVSCHIYTFNQCDTTEEWRQRVLASLEGARPE